MMEYTARPLANDEMQVVATGGVKLARDDLQLASVELGILNSDANVNVTVLPAVICLFIVKLRS